MSSTCPVTVEVFDVFAFQVCTKRPAGVETCALAAPAVLAATACMTREAARDWTFATLRTPAAIVGAVDCAVLPPSVNT